MYRIYINESVLIITESIPKNAESYQKVDSQEFNFLNFYQKAMESAMPQAGLLLISEPDKLFKKIKKSFRIIKAAGGVVSNEENKYLFIFRREKWDLPKGKIDPGEKTKEAAVREVEEECGIKVHKAGSKIGDTWHTYELKGQRILKKTSWYNMKVKGNPKLIPQIEEDITEVRWVGKEDLKVIGENTYLTCRHPCESRDLKAVVGGI
jgi:hypothetical protein